MCQQSEIKQAPGPAGGRERAELTDTVCRQHVVLRQLVFDVHTLAAVGDVSAPLTYG